MQFHAYRESCSRRRSARRVGRRFRPSRRRRIRAGRIITEDGLHRQPWFIDSLLELADDLTAATANKKRFAILWELRGCPYCKKMHEINLANPAIANYIKERFDILQLNFIGSREVTDFDGEKLSEKAVRAKYGVRGTPTFQFFPENAAACAEKAVRARSRAPAGLYRAEAVPRRSVSSPSARMRRGAWAIS